MNNTVWKAGQRSPRGSLLIFVAATAVVLIIVGVVLFNVTTIFGGKREAHNAGEAAALLAAREISSITVNTTLGDIGLVDLAPRDPRNPNFQRNPANEIPVIGFNTAMATLRLDRLIAEDLNNQDMKDLCARDLQVLRQTAVDLNNTIANKVAPQTPIWMKVKDIYDENNRRLGGSARVDAGTFAIILGRMSQGQGETNVPVPSTSGPTGDAGMANHNINGFYEANVVIPVSNLNFAFTTTADSPKLVSESHFIGQDDTANFPVPGFGPVPCCVVRVHAEDKVSAFANDQTDNRQRPRQTSNMKTDVCACTGSERQRTRSTVYTIGFGSFPSTRLFPQLSIQNIINFQGWEDPSDHQPSTWLKATNGDYPRGGNGLSATPFSPNGPAIQSPGVALSSGLYDWLRSLRLRPRRTDVIAMFRSNLRERSEDREVPADNSDTTGSEENDGPEDTEDVTEGDVDPCDDVESPTMGCMFRPPVGTDPRYAAFLSGDDAGAQMYFDAFNYRNLDIDLCPDESIPVFVDPITGKATGQAGNDIIELCQLVEGTVASNHAGFTSLVAGRAARLDAIEARRSIRDIRSGIRNAQSLLNSIARADRRGHEINGFKSSLVAQMNILRSQSNNYQALSLLRTSPVPDDRRVFHGATPKDVLNELASDNFHDGNIENQAQKYMNGRYELDKVFDEEHQRVEEVRRRAGRCRRNGRTAMRKSVRLVRRLRKWSNRGIRRLDIANGHNLFPPDPAFAVNIRRPKRPNRPTGGVAATRVVFIIPNNGRAVIRNNSQARPHFFKLGQVTTTEVDTFKASLEKVTAVHDRRNFNHDDFEGLEQLSSGSHLFPQHKNKVLDVRSELDRNVRPFARNWDSEERPLGFNHAAAPSRTGLAFMRLYRRLTVGDRSKTGGMPPEMGSYIKLRDFRRMIYEAQFGHGVAKTGIIETDGAPADTIPGYEQVFVLSCDGDASFDNNQGQINVDFIRNPLNADPRYPFGSNLLLAQQFLYFAGTALQDGTAGNNPDHPTSTFRAVIARDQFADMRQGTSYRLQPNRNWCKGAYGVTIGRGAGECPYPAGEWRLGNAYSIACCKLNPDAVAIKIRPRDFESFLQPQPLEGDTDDADVALLEQDIDDNLETCPLLIKPVGRTGRLKGFL